MLAQGKPSSEQASPPKEFVRLNPLLVRLPESQRGCNEYSEFRKGQSAVSRASPDVALAAFSSLFRRWTGRVLVCRQHLAQSAVNAFHAVLDDRDA